MVDNFNFFFVSWFVVMFLENVYMGKILMDNVMIFYWKFKKIRKNCEVEFDIVYYERC